VGNLPLSTTEDELADLFGTVGPVMSVKIERDRMSGRSRGVGLVEMADEDARKAIDQLAGTTLHGRTLTITEAGPPTQT